MKGKTKRKAVWLAGLALIAFLGTGWAIVLRTGEDPDYVRAAALLPVLRKQAKMELGPLSQKEFLLESGLEVEDTTAEWEQIAHSAPKVIKDEFNYELRGDRPIDSVKVYREGSVWFGGLRKSIEPLISGNKVLPSLAFEAYSSIKSIVQKCSEGMVGAAMEGDAATVAELGKTLNDVIAYAMRQPDTVGILVARAHTSYLSNAVLSGAVRCKNNRAVMSALEAILAGTPKPVSFRALVACDTREQNTGFDRLRKIPFAELRLALEEDNQSSGATSSGGAGPVQTLIERLRNLGGSSNRMGPHTVDAWEARALESSLLKLEAFSKGYLAATEVVSAYRERIRASGDVSFEMSEALTLDGALTSIESQLRSDFGQSATIVTFELVRRYPSVALLPLELPKDVELMDPFAGKPAVYKRYENGFVLYSVGPNGVDEDLLKTAASFTSPRAKFVKAGKDDWGFVVSYAK